MMVDLSNAVAKERTESYTRNALPATIAGGIAVIAGARLATATGYVPSLYGLPDTGQLTSIGLPISQFVHEMAGIAVVGALLLNCAVLRQGAGPSRRHLAELVSRWAWIWVAGTLLWIVFTISDLIGTPVGTLPAHGESVLIVLGTNRVLSEIATLWVALAMALFGRRWTGRISSFVALVVSTGAMLPSALTGHASHHASPLLASSALGVHVAASAIWVGGLLVLVVHLRCFPEQLRQAIPSFSRIALVCVAAIGASGVLESVVTLNGGDSLWQTNRGHLIIAKSAAFVILAGIGFLHRRRTVDAAWSGRLLPLLRLAAWELALMGGTVGIAVVLSTTA